MDARSQTNYHSLQSWREMLVSPTLWRWSWLLIFFVAVFMRPPYPMDETRYLAVAWEMWRDGHLLLPHLNGVPYPDKPPLLFWLWHAGWGLFGVNEEWPRFLTAAFMGASAWCLYGIARRLWPGQTELHRKAPMVFAGTMYVALYTQMLMFDSLLVFFTLATIYALLATGPLGMVAGLLTGLGMLAKGPIILVYTLPLLFLLPAVNVKKTNLFIVYLGSSLMPPTAWLVLLLANGHGDFVHELFFGQIAQRVDGEIGHGRSIWWYLPYLPVVFLPWSLFPQAWRQFYPWVRNNRIAGKLLAASGLSLLVLSMIGGKQVHYLLPLIATTALPLSCLLTGTGTGGRISLRAFCALVLFAIVALMLPAILLQLKVVSVPDGGYIRWWPALLPVAAVIFAMSAPDRMREYRLELAAILSVILALAILLIAIPIVNRSHDLRAAATLISEAQQAGLPVAYVNSYQGQFDFFGRLQRPLTEIREADIPEWQNAHPDGFIVAREKYAAVINRRLIYSQPYRSGELFIYAPDAMPDSAEPIAILIQSWL